MLNHVLQNFKVIKNHFFFNFAILIEDLFENVVLKSSSGNKKNPEINIQLPDPFNILDETITRGCLPKNENAAQSICGVNNENCTICFGSLCNGNPEVIETVTCIRCDSNEDPTCGTELSNATNETCLNYSMQLGCFHFFNESSRAIRGCMSSLSETNFKYCIENNDECKMCIGNNCNSKQSFEKCQVCDSAVNKNCIRSPGLVEPKVCKYYDDECFTRIGDTTVSRGCLMEMDEKFVSECRENNRKCERCNITPRSYSKTCNLQILTLSTCIECNSIVDENCRNGPELINEKLCGFINSTEKENCYMHTYKQERVAGVDDEEDHVKRGCLSDISSHHKESCLLQSECKTCLGENCNKKVAFQQCYGCESSSNKGCTQIDENDVLKSPVITCKDYYASCETGIDHNGNTHRFCSDEPVEKNNFFLVNETCSDSKCNKNVFPKNRLQCIQCGGNSDCDNLSSDNNTKALEPAPCNIFTESDQCFTLLDESSNHFCFYLFKRICEFLIFFCKPF